MKTREARDLNDTQNDALREVVRALVGLEKYGTVRAVAKLVDRQESGLSKFLSGKQGMGRGSAILAIRLARQEGIPVPAVLDAIDPLAGASVVPVQTVERDEDRYRRLEDFAREMKAGSGGRINEDHIILFHRKMGSMSGVELLTDDELRVRLAEIVRNSEAAGAALLAELGPVDDTQKKTRVANQAERANALRKKK